MSAIKYHGGKHYLAKRIVNLMPPHTRYIEPYAGGLSVLMAKNCEGISEFANDLNGDLMNFWRVLRDTPERFLQALWGTPVSQAAFIEAKQVAYSDNVRRATAFFVRARQSRQGLGKDYLTPTSRIRRGMNENVSAWLSSIEGLPEIHQRLQRVELWETKAVDFIGRLDSKDCLVYADPPYLHETRSSVGEYGALEMSPDQHRELLEKLSGICGFFMLSGYDSDLYRQFEQKCGWWRIEFDLPNNASSAKVKERKREVIWTNFEVS